MEGTLAERHERGRRVVNELARQDKYWISLGGGHDYGYCDTTAFVQAYKEHKPLVINFDAHLDVRPVHLDQKSQGLHSGTAFFRMMNEFGHNCSFIEVGLQAHCNSPYHARWLNERGGRIVWREAIDEYGMVESLQQLVPLAIHPAFISVDVDALSSSIAPGCSQSWASGLQWQEFIRGFDFLIDSFDVKGIGIYEVSPVLDEDNKTSKLAALIMHRFIFQTLKKSE
jgi:formiminoglutamase